MFAIIIREMEDEFVLIRQHDHAALSAALARAASERFLPDGRFSAELLYAIEQHDRGWIELDETPIWNDAAGRPFAFEDYPLLPKMAYYRRGIEEAEAVSPYAGLLISLFYTAFFEGFEGAQVDAFRKLEEVRQRRIRMNMRAAAEEVALDVARLQLFDSLSLYACLNDPGTPKNEEHPWYRAGFGASRKLFPDRDILSACWEGPGAVRFSAPVLERELTTALPVKRIPRRFAGEIGIDAAYSRTSWTIEEVAWLPPE